MKWKQNVQLLINRKGKQVGMGLGATVIGIIMIVRIRRIQTRRNYHRIFRKVKKRLGANSNHNHAKGRQ